MDLQNVIVRLHDMAAAWLALLPSLEFGMLVFALFFLRSRAARAGVTCTAELRARSPGLAVVLGRLAGGLCIMLGLFIVAAIAFPYSNAADLFGLLGIGGVAIGFAFCDIRQNLLAGILLLLTQPLRLGDGRHWT